MWLSREAHLNVWKHEHNIPLKKKFLLRISTVNLTKSLVPWGSGDICDAFHDLVALLQFKKREKHPWRSVNFSRIFQYHYHLLTHVLILLLALFIYKKYADVIMYNNHILFPLIWLVKQRVLISKNPVPK